MPVFSDKEKIWRSGCKICSFTFLARKGEMLSWPADDVFRLSIIWLNYLESLSGIKSPPQHEGILFACFWQILPVSDQQWSARCDCAIRAVLAEKTVKHPQICLFHLFHWQRHRLYKLCKWNCTAQLPDDIMRGEWYEARVRVQPIKHSSTWSEWGPTVSWLALTGNVTQKPAPSGKADSLMV